jgi:hypothetical protein
MNYAPANPIPPAMEVDVADIVTDRTIHVDCGDGVRMTVPRPDWLWPLIHRRPEPDRGTKCDDRMLAAGVFESYLYLIQDCTKDEAWRRIRLMRHAVFNQVRASSSDASPDGKVES